MAISGVCGRAPTPRPGADAVLKPSLLGQQLVEVGLGLAHCRADLFETDKEPFDLRYPVGHIPRYVLGRVELRFLGEEPDGEAGRQAGLRP